MIFAPPAPSLYKQGFFFSLFSDPPLHLSFSVRPFSLMVMKLDSLTSLGLRSLREISEGSVYISNNTNLCYQHTVKWQQIFTGTQPKRRLKLNDIKFNKPARLCGKMSIFLLRGHIILSRIHAMYSALLSASVCVCVLTEAEGHVCDPLCSNLGCWGPGPEQCLSCRNHSRRHTCVAQCNIFSGSVRV